MNINEFIGGIFCFLVAYWAYINVEGKKCIGLKINPPPFTENDRIPAYKYNNYSLLVNCWNWVGN